ncbi:hypothetical protein RYX36_013087, partial [Vicia faba]
WTKYFDRLIDPVFPKLVKEFWIHATTSNRHVMSYVMGKKIVIIEDLIGKLIGHDRSGIKCSEMEEKAKVHLPHIMFNHLKTSVKETREKERTKRELIPLRILISDILKEIRLIEYLTEAQQENLLEPCARKPLNAKNLKKMKIIGTIKKDPTLTTKEVITTRRVPQKDFPLFTQVDSSPEIVLRYLEACKSDGTILDVNILDLRQQPLGVSTRKSRKRKDVGEGTSQKPPKVSKKK